MIIGDGKENSQNKRTAPIIGANSVVLKDIPANCVFAGNPAKTIKQIT